MLSDVAISVREVSKTFRITTTQARATTLGELLTQKLRKPFSRHKREANFEALRDVSFEVKRGEVLGIVGRNGAGKSTLLKILSQITPPTSGEIDLRGRVGSLLEVGTGFHPELTGRENIYLNGALLGMSRREISREFDSIVAFAETEQFLDMPVKRYSSGMYVRLAFAVAAHLQPDILIVDEVLAVGDMAFQKKCIEKMSAVSRCDGRTVLFVSHNMSTVAQLCDRAVCLHAGRVVSVGVRDDVIRYYLTTQGRGGGVRELVSGAEPIHPGRKTYFRSVSLINREGEATCEFDVRHPIQVRMSYETPEPLSRLELSVRVLTAEGDPVFTTLRSDLAPESLLEQRHGAYECCVTIPGMSLMPGDYLLNVAAHAPMGEIYDVHEGVLAFTIHDTGTSFAKYGNYASIGVVIMNLPWEERAMANHV